MSGSFTVGALAAAAREANAVGAVRLTLLPDKLEIELLRAGSFSDGYVPGGLTRFVRFAVPYRAVRGLVRSGNGVLLSLDPRVATPHNRFFLTRFTDLPLEALGAAHKRRGLLRATSWLAPLPLALWAVSVVPDAWVSGHLGRASFGLIVLIVSAFSLRRAASMMDVGGPFSARLRDALELRLAQRMGFYPSAIHETDPFEVPLEEIQIDAGVLPKKKLRPLPTVDANLPAVPFADVQGAAERPEAPTPDTVTVEARPRGWPLVAVSSAPSTALAPNVDGPVTSRIPSARPATITTTRLHSAFDAPASDAVTSDAHPASQAQRPVATPLARRPHLAALVAAPVPAPSRGYGMFALTAGLAAAALVLALSGGRIIAALQPTAKTEPPPPTSPLETLPAGAVAAVEDATPALPSCTCARADSPLWSGGLPVLSVLTTPKNPSPTRGSSDITPKPGKRGRGLYDFDVVIVNNGAAALRDVRVVLTFARRNAEGERIGATDRGLFWGGELSPGRSAKWGVKAPGTELRIDLDEKRLLGEVLPAPADAFDRLIGSQKVAVRLHAATMLAYLGDPRAADVARSLGPLHPSDEETRARVLRAAEPLKVCDARYDAGRLSLCAWNGSDSERDGLLVTEVAAQGDGRVRTLERPLAAKSGARVSFDDFGGPAEELVLGAARTAD